MDEKLYFYESYDVAVIGAGHAGCEAALACARLGLNTILFTVQNVECIQRSCGTFPQSTGG